MGDIVQFKPTPYVVRGTGGITVEMYHCVLLPDGITFAELAHALRHSALCISTDPDSACQVITRRPPPPPGAA